MQTNPFCHLFLKTDKKLTVELNNFEWVDICMPRGGVIDRAIKMTYVLPARRKRFRTVPKGKVRDISA